MSAPRDLFSAQAATYASFRPHYPPALFDHLAQLAPGRTLAWDCATGNGQAAIGLAERFERVIATDASEAQLRAAIPRPNIEYRRATAESCGLEARSVDLVTVAQALHWLDLPRFYAEVKRVLVPNGIIAALVYDLPSVAPEIDRVIHRFYEGTVGAYWTPERKLVDEHYRTVPFPFEELPAPRIAMQSQLTLEQLLGYVRSWSATQRYIEAQGSDPIAPLARELATVWSDPAVPRLTTWPLFARIGRAA